ncbi:unnamed protein product [Sphagnum troendelagicum]|uniref:rhamnogalacturonan endolyase n=1 Tax=Sphagnum troendelagicum TaxID=128251 RepID=A0ABP0U5S9_9BRYO
MAHTPTPGIGIAGPDVRLLDRGRYVVLDNGIVQMTLTKPEGIITCLSYGGIKNVFETRNKETNRGYWDLNWNKPNEKDTFDVISGTDFHVVHQDVDRVEVSFVRPYNPNVNSTGIPLNIDKRFALLRGSSGFYSYSIYERPTDWPGFTLSQTRITFKLSKDSFHHIAVADNKQKLMPAPEDRMPDRCEPLAYPEAVRLTNPIEPSLRGEVDDKYEYATDNRDNRVQGWMSSNPMVGFWVITASDEFRNGGPLKQNLTSHVGPTCLSMFHSAHYVGAEMCAHFQDGEPWQKVLGPVFIYLNSAPPGMPLSALWEDAKRQAWAEIRAWPYCWPESPDFPKASERGTVSGHLLVHDSFSEPSTFGGKYAFVGLANPGETGSWQTDSKGYQFWTQADTEGYFTINNIRTGVYDVYGWVPGVIGDYKYAGGPLHIQPGSTIDLGEMVFYPPRDGPTIWEIGIPDRTAAEFFIPDPNPKYINRLYINSNEKWRQYGLWERYTDLYPTQDLVYTIGKSDWRTDWFFAHLNRIKEDGTYAATTWQVKFNLDTITDSGIYKFRIATAASSNAAIQVYINVFNPRKPLFDTMQFGKDNAIARHGIHGLYRLWTVDIPFGLLHVGENTLFLTQRKPSGPFTGVMYDYLRLEAPHHPAAAATAIQGSASA